MAWTPIDLDLIEDSVDHEPMRCVADGCRIQAVVDVSRRMADGTIIWDAQACAIHAVRWSELGPTHRLYLDGRALPVAG